MSEHDSFIRFCGQLVFSPENTGWDTFPPEQKEEFCRLAWKGGWGAFFVRYLKTALPETYYGKFREVYRRESLRRLAEQIQLEDFYKLMEREKIPFVPVKGADLAFRIYPDQALRPHGDWDILFRKEDCAGVFHLLQKHNWQTFSGVDDSEDPLCHHYERMHNGLQALEIHWTLPDFGLAGPEDFWAETECLTPYHRVLTPEMNLLLVSAHASADHYTHVSAARILADAGMILKYTHVDWEKVHSLADRWKILRPDVLFSAWSEFFPDGMLPSESMASEQRKLVREIFDLRGNVRKYSVFEKSVASTCHHDFHWIMSKLKFYLPSYIRQHYHIPEHQWGKIFFLGARDFFSKFFFFLTHSGNENPELKAYYLKVEALEKSVKCRQK